MPEIGDELREVDAAAGPREETRCRERSGGEAAGVIGILRSEAARKRREFSRSSLAHDLVLRQREQMANADLGIVGERHVLCVCAGEASSRWCSRGCRGLLSD